MSRIEEKRQREISIVTKMIEVYCRKKHDTKDGLCPECQELLDYATMRSSHCPFMETKTFCANCRVHCYKPEMRERIKTVMRKKNMVRETMLGSCKITLFSAANAIDEAMRYFDKTMVYDLYR